ncbi:hypothetical protein WJX79_009478 [Trebouxia sp. C0005]
MGGALTSRSQQAIAPDCTARPPKPEVCADLGRQHTAIPPGNHLPAADAGGQESHQRLQAHVLAKANEQVSQASWVWQ